MKKIDKNYYFIFIITLIIFIPLISSKYFYGHDSLFHFANVKVISSLFPSVIRSGIANDFGYGIGLFYPFFPHFITNILNNFFDIFISFKIINFLIILLSGIFMYKFTNLIFKDKNISLISSISYITFPYFINDLYVRFAYSEMFIFVLIPIVMMGLYYLFMDNYKKFYLYFCLGLILIVNCHLVLGFYFSFILLGILLFNIRKLDIKKIKALLVASIFIILSSLWFIIPMLEHRSLGIYNVFVKGGMATNSSVYSHALTFRSFFDTSLVDNVYTFIPIITLLLLGIGYYKKKDILDKDKLKVYNCFLIILLILVFVSSKLFFWKSVPNLFLLIQFPWRLEIFIGFFISILMAISIKFFNKKYINLIIMIFIISSITTANNIIYKTNFYTTSKIDKTVSINGVGWNNDYLPLNIINNYSYYENRDKDLIVIKGNNNIKFNIIKDETPYLELDISFKDKYIVIELPRIYYLGYDISLKTDNGIKKIEYSQSDMGFIKVKLEEEGKVIVKYKGTKIANVSKVISILTFVIGMLLYVKFFVKR
ncbi:MAG: 6-pyruvoyl-tetrahydropterin synthase-related protein [Bacilli bacterium]|nr:6-pyruvoyl-tetrahydropterin synthase-related protein [Bacilli bacterium]